MPVTHWLLVCISAPVGAFAGALAGWFGVGSMLVAFGRGGHADLAIVWLAAALTGAVATLALPVALHRRLAARARQDTQPGPE